MSASNTAKCWHDAAGGKPDCGETAEPGRNALLDAGQRLLATADLARISVNAIVAEAGMAKGSFYQHWPSRAEYVRALHVRFHDELVAAIDAAMADLPPGYDRLAAGMNAYLDGCPPSRPPRHCSCSPAPRPD